MEQEEWHPLGKHLPTCGEHPVDLRKRIINTQVYTAYTWNKGILENPALQKKSMDLVLYCVPVIFQAAWDCIGSSSRYAQEPVPSHGEYEEPTSDQENQHLDGA